MVPGRDIGYTFATKLNSQSSLAEIKRAYLKAIRLVHPDKQQQNISSVDHASSDASALERQVLAAEVFALLHKSFNDFSAEQT